MRANGSTSKGTTTRATFFWRLCSLQRRQTRQQLGQLYLLVQWGRHDRISNGHPRPETDPAQVSEAGVYRPEKGLKVCGSSAASLADRWRSIAAKSPLNSRRRARFVNVAPGRRQARGASVEAQSQGVDHPAPRPRSG
jgi:hypothetical protein